MTSNRLFWVLGVVVAISVGIFGYIFFGGDRLLNNIEEAISPKREFTLEESIEKRTSDVYLVGKFIIPFKLDSEGVPESTFVLSGDPNGSGVKLRVFSLNKIIFVGDPSRPAELPKFMMVPYKEIPSSVPENKAVKIKISGNEAGGVYSDFYEQAVKRIEEKDLSVLKDEGLILYTDFIEILE